MLKPIIDGDADVVYGSRFLGGSDAKRVLYFKHRIANSILTFFSNVLTDINLTDMETGYKVLPYMQDFSDDEHNELSLAVVILDKSKEKQLEQMIMQLANKHGIKFDLYGERNNNQIDGLIRGDLYDNMI